MPIEPEQPAAALVAQPVVMHATIHITRAATGAVETYEITGTVAEPTASRKDVAAA